MKQGIAYLPEDRKIDGIVGDLSVRDNIILAAQVLRGFFRPFSKAEKNKFAEEYIKLLEIKTASADTPIKALSGGNQQKVILARWLLTHPEYLILDEPTRGIDVGTKAVSYTHLSLIGVVLLISILFVAVTANDYKKKEGTGQGNSEQEKLVTIGFSQVGAESNWRTAN